ncbi:MAG: hypothetical protein ACWGQW_02415 [bacterium]
MTISDAPHILYGGDQRDYKRLYRSQREIALIEEINISPGHGVLPVGTVMALNASAAGNIGNAVPYFPTTPAAGDPNQGKAGAYLVQDGSGTTLYVTLDDSYKFVVGDDIIIKDSDTATTSSENLGAITAIDRTTYTHMAVITVTSSVSGAFTVANGAIIHVECGADNTNGWSDAVGILEKSVDTGTGETAKGAQGTMVVKNAMLYKGSLVNWDAAALTDLGATDRNNIIHL